MNQEFLSMSNLQHLMDITNRFLYDKYNFRMTEADGAQTMVKEFQEMMVAVHSNFMEQGNGFDIRKMNMGVLSTMKDRIKNRHNLQITQEQAFVNNMAQQTVVSAALPMNGNPFDADERIQEDVLEEDEFMSKVRLLEQNRKQSAPVVATVPVTQVAQPVQPVQQSIAPIVVQQPIPSINVPTKNLKQNTIMIHAKDRNWTFAAARNTWVWSGPLPSGMELGSLKFSALFLHHAIVSTTPFINVEIVGAGGQKINTIFISSVQVTKGWASLIPLHPNQLMHPLATPWTIRILDAYENPLMLGEDGLTISSCEFIGYRQYSINLNNTNSFSVGDILTIGDQGVTATVIRDGGSLFVTSASDLKACVGKGILNTSAQPSLVLEVGM